MFGGDACEGIPIFFLVNLKKDLFLFGSFRLNSYICTTEREITLLTIKID